jgi:4,5-DOPA dioxygenase extradiol
MTMPAIFFGHGSPMNALDQNDYTRAWAVLGARYRPRAILMVSAHWYLPGVAVTAQERPRTIHDFGGFPRALFEVEYPAPGDAALVDRVIELLGPDVRRDRDWGLDHGTWSVLVHAYPKADVPVVQLSIDETRPAAFHYDLAKKLRALRDEDVLIAGSGNVVHNLHEYAWGGSTQERDWATRFEARAKELLLAGDHTPLIDYESLGSDAMLSIPTPEHYLPLLYVAAQQRAGETVSFPIDGIEGGSLSMLSVVVGG